MKALSTLPDGYRSRFTLDLQKDKKLALLVNGLSFAIATVLIVAMHLYRPVWLLFDMEEGLGAYFTRFFVLLVMLAAYMVLHELVHGAAMKLCGTKSVHFGFTGLYAYAGSDDYYDKSSYIFVALAPIVVWGVVLAVVNVFVDGPWFWTIYVVQICNLSGAAGDLFVTVKLARLPKDVLVHDVGVSMTVYTREEPGYES